jgi:hypothetical protein
MALAGCIDPCGNEVLKEVASPDARRRAVVFQRSCGATTGFSTHVSVLDAGESVGVAAGNAFTADGPIMDLLPAVRWESAEKVVVAYPSWARVFRREGRVKSVQVGYEER